MGEVRILRDIDGPSLDQKLVLGSRCNMPLLLFDSPELALVLSHF